MRLPLFIPTPDEAALLPGERRRIALDEEPRMLTAIRLALRGGGEVAFLAWDTAMRPGFAGPDELSLEQLLGVATRARILAADETHVTLRGIERLRIESAEHGGTCCAHDDPVREGTEAHCAPMAEATGELRSDLLAGFDLAPQLRGEGAPRLDRLAAWMALPPWVQGQFLGETTIESRQKRLLDHASELAAAGSSFRADERDAPYESDEAYLADCVRCYEARARALRPSLREGEVESAASRRRRRAAAHAVRAIRARIERRLAASEQLPAAEALRRRHELSEGAMDALLVAALGSHQRFAEPLRQAARLLPPGELPLAAWIEGLA